MTLEEVEFNLAAVTTKLTVIDKIISASKLGVDMVMVFRCNHSGLYYPSDYVREWGRLYGIGLGPDPVSEALNTEYEVDPPAITPDIRRVEQIMHPVGHCRVQVDMHLVAADLATFAIPVHEDQFMEKRAEIIRTKQLANPRSKLPMVMLAWERVRKGEF